jgi:hypothetical protein
MPSVYSLFKRIIMPQILPAAVHAIVKEKDFKNVHKLLIMDKEPRQSWKSNGLTTTLHVN